MNRRAVLGWLAATPVSSRLARWQRPAKVLGGEWQPSGFWASPDGVTWYEVLLQPNDLARLSRP